MERKKERKEERKKVLFFTVIKPMAKIVQSVVQDNCDMVQTSDNNSNCSKTCPNTTLPITNPKRNVLVSNLGD